MTCTETRIAGIGNLDGDVFLSVSTSGSVECTNGGGQVVEVKTQSTSTTSGDAFTRNRNGTLIVSQISAAVATGEQLLANAECPKSDTNNKNWDKALSGTPTVTYIYTLRLEGFGADVIHQPPR